MLRVVVESAKGIPKKKLGNPDPIAAVVFKGEKKKTKAIDSELNPVWNEVSINIYIYNPSSLWQSLGM
ncbi:unnamed protein product [Oncorhynchus mykiss]|uniref:C2 domain-containing protein n=1 Tax=Oncorhynchus mykiss TaxID=8022 RepID=A0A060Z2C6_ONCMY|nr:unnamed protein product [Oncorhynchus mykiss]